MTVSDESFCVTALKQKKRGFTLAELLIALAILGIIATFTLPKLLNTTGDSSRNSKAKEAAAMVAEALSIHRQKGLLSANTGIGDLTPYMNYLRTDSSTIIDAKPTQTSYACDGSGGSQCLVLHNGGIVRYALSSSYKFGCTTNMCATWFLIDPDGSYSGTTDTGKAVQFWIYYNGRITTYKEILPNTCSNGGCSVNPNPLYDPDWFSW